MSTSEEPNSSASENTPAELLLDNEPQNSEKPKEMSSSSPKSLKSLLYTGVLNCSPDTSQNTKNPQAAGELGVINTSSGGDAILLQEPCVESSTLTVVVFGNSSAVDYGDKNLLLGPANVHQQHVPVPTKRLESGRLLFIINMLDLHQGELYLDPVEQITDHSAPENIIHAFILVLQLETLTDDDKHLLDWLQSEFGKSSPSSVMVLLTYEKDENSDLITDWLKNPVLEQLIERCGNQYHTCSRSMNNHSEMRSLLQKVEKLASENHAHYCYTAEMNYSMVKLGGDTQGREERICGDQLQDYGCGGGVGVRTEENRKGQEPKLQQCGEPAGGPNKDEAEGSKETMRKLFNRLNLSTEAKLKTSDFLKITELSLSYHQPCKEKDLVSTFLQRLLMMDYKARYIAQEQQISEARAPLRAADSEDIFSSLFTNSVLDSRAAEKFLVHPMDIQMAAFHSADNFLRQLMVTKLSQCQFAVPLIVPDPFTRKVHFPLWTLRQVKKSWKMVDRDNKTTGRCKPMFGVPTPMVAFYRLGSPTSSKSQLINNLISERHHTFFHRNCPQSSKTRLLMDGLVEIAWYCPSDKNYDWLTDCTAFCNLHGDAGIHRIQREVLTELATVNVVMLSTLGTDDSNRNIIKALSNSSKLVIFLLADSDSTVEEIFQGKYKIGLKDRSHSDVAEELKKTLRKCCSNSEGLRMTQDPVFKVEDIHKHAMVVMDEETEVCQKAKEAANQIMTLINQEELSNIKEKLLPCQGTLWHNWCHKNKNLYRLIEQPEKQKAAIQQKMNQIRSQQQDSAFSPLIDLFLQSLEELGDVERVYFLKWIGILLDIHTSDYLSELHHQYDQQWAELLKLKKTNKSSPLVNEKQAELEKISDMLNDAAFGVEHILREMGQIYECWSSIQNTHMENQAKIQSLPQIAAEIIISGFPLELMDGDAAHVPLTWVSAVLDELIKKLGDQRVFVLSVLGIQSSGKSTMLNAMFGLQFAVSAGRCTRGAFMQLIRVSEEMKEGLQFDYILVVDTEGLRALETTGKTTIHHDNELATFVIGLGNLTLINIFGENPAEMQDILQIVVQAFLRMKMVRLNPSCMFVHQNVGDITAGEKTMEARRRLQEKLDEMTKLAAKEEDSEAECFSDIISFEVQNDVRYFAQLWEGSPPMAPPNPSYSQSVHELKKSILSKVSGSRGLTLSEFKFSVGDLWKALLNENFVFSFRNTLEIAAYRRLEHEYSKWTWSLRSTMRAVENKLHNRANNESSFRVEQKDLVAEMKDTKKQVDEATERFFTEDHDKEILVQWRERFGRKIEDLYSELVEGTKSKLDQVCKQKAARERVNAEKTQYENQLFKLSKELAISLKNNDPDEHAFSSRFHDVWSRWVAELTQDAPSVGATDIPGDITKILSETFEFSLVCERQNLELHHYIDVCGNYSDYVILKKSQEPLESDEHLMAEDVNVNISKGYSLFGINKVASLAKGIYSKFSNRKSDSSANQLSSNDNDLLRELAKNVFQQIDEEIQQICSGEFGYDHSYIQQIIHSVKTKINVHEQTKPPYLLKKEFTVDLCLHVCKHAAERFAELQEQFKEANDVKLYLEKQKPQYFNVFKNYCEGANSARVFGEFIVNKLEPSIVQAAYEQSGLDVAEKMKCDVPAFNGNRSNLEKKILTSLAEEENFQSYITYLYKPKEHFNNFITQQVDSYLKENTSGVLETIRGNIETKAHRVMEAVAKVTAEVKTSAGDVKMWLQSLSKALKDELQFKEESCLDQKEIQDLDFLQQVVNESLTAAVSQLQKKFKNVPDLDLERFRKKPREIMIEHLCRCCWAQCPFCHAICTNTIEDHDGDHSVRFHRNCGIMGWSFMFSKNLGVEFCTTAVSTAGLLFLTNDKIFQFKDYRSAGGEHAKWNICRDDSEMPYWKWFMCKFQKDLEKHYSKAFKEGDIPQEWRQISKEKAVEGLSDM